MTILEELDSKLQQVMDLRTEVDNKIEDIIKWCRDNRQLIKKHFPQKGKVYKIKSKDHYDFLHSKYYDYQGELYFKVTDIKFDPANEYHHMYRKSMPTVRGMLLDSEMNQLQMGDKRVTIDNLVDFDDKDRNSRKGKTKVYVMIDKNTGYYKIGRSVNPKAREKTLQSEKPTIELIHCYNALNRHEKELHNMFRDKRIRGEWFDLSGTDLNKINQYFNRATT